MKLYVLFGQRKESYEGEYAPEVMAATDEFTLDENPDGWAKELKRAKDSYGDAMVETRVVAIEVDQDKLRERILGVRPMKGIIVE